MTAPHQFDRSDNSFEWIELFHDEEFTPVQNDIIECTTQVVCACCGRRVGKTHSGTRKLATWVHDDLARLWLDLQLGKRERWIGEGYKKTVAEEVQPDILYWVVAPREDHLAQIRGYLLKLYAEHGRAFQHPKFPDWFSKRNRRFWLWHDGICARIDFIPCTSPTAMVSKGLNGVWVDEAGYVPNDRYQALKPALWEHGGRMLATGTPSLGDDHWFTRLSAAGLSEDHERYSPAIAKRDSRVTTFVADTIHHAYSETARKEAMRDAVFMGELWAAHWIWADWRQRESAVFREWDPKLHVVEYRPHTSSLFRRRSFGERPIYGHIGKHVIYDAPDKTYGIVDWSGGTAPGAAVVCLVWNQNPINKDDPRALVLVVEDYEGHEAYTSDPSGWWSILGALDRKWGIDKWIGDPHAPKLIRSARRAGIPIEEGPAQDKMGRLSLVAALMHSDHQSGVHPAFYVSNRCEHLPRELSTYKWQRKRDGTATNQPKQNNDHTIDCVAMLVSDIVTGSRIAVGGNLYG